MRPLSNVVRIMKKIDGTFLYHPVLSEDGCSRNKALCFGRAKWPNIFSWFGDLTNTAGIATYAKWGFCYLQTRRIYVDQCWPIYSWGALKHKSSLWDVRTTHLPPLWTFSNLKNDLAALEWTHNRSTKNDPPSTRFWGAQLKARTGAGAGYKNSCSRDGLKTMDVKTIII